MDLSLGHVIHLMPAFYFVSSTNVINKEHVKVEYFLLDGGRM